ncbi:MULTISPECIES: CRISPR-associated protein Cas4 [Anaerolinea]|jgi:CRISPR-associated exonuclease Cas4|uniref:CRISPR-associated protein Cas4 n=1 Tax=Anaerolinea TaxID=233189 RepID=UPI00263626E3|nr:CRISPR-associated protein Cas4 [Anaerolinea thermophila]
MQWMGLGLLLLLLAAFLLFWSRQRLQSAGLPLGRIVSTDTAGWRPLEKPLYDPETGLTGKPDYVVKVGGALVPVEVKSGWAPAEPYDSHIFQLAAYCLLLARTSGKRPPYGLIHYRNRTFAVDYTPALEEALLAVVEEMHADQRRTAVHRSHDEPARCARCGFRSVCDQRL